MRGRCGKKKKKNNKSNVENNQVLTILSIKKKSLSIRSHFMTLIATLDVEINLEMSHNSQSPMIENESSRFVYHPIENP